MWFAFDWGLFERRFKSILQRLTSHCELVDREAAAVHFLDMKRMREEREREEETYEKHRNHQLSCEVLAWLAADEDSQEDYLHRLSDERRPETCDWILAQGSILSWMNDHLDAVPTVWMTGIPGAGKTFVCSLIVQHAEIRQDQSVLYYFCGQRHSGRDSQAFLLRTLAVQVLRQNLHMAPLIHQAFLQKGSGRSAPNTKLILKDLLSTIKPTRIIVDGIDEWEDRVQREVLRSLTELQKAGSDGCKLLISSRKEPLIRKELLHAEHLHIVNQSLTGLRAYVQSITEELKDRFPDFADTVWERVEELLQEKANGMFLWVRLVKSSLEDCASEIEFDSRINDLPLGLNEAYGRILDRINRLNPLTKERALRVLYWVCLAYRSVGIDEVADALALKPGQTELSRRTRIQNVDRDILDVCAPIVERTKNGCLEAVHLSAKEYLIDAQSGHFVKTQRAHFDIAFSCVVNLTSALTVVPKFCGSTTEEDLERLVVAGSFGLQAYSHQHWADHVIAFFESRLNHNMDSEQICASGGPHVKDTTKILDALKDLSRVLKSYGHPYDGLASLSGPLPVLECLKNIQQRPPEIEYLLTAWIQFKSKLAKMGTEFEDLRAQQQWQLHEDETYLSLVEQRLCNITERLLSLDPSSLPPHIDGVDHKTFLARFALPCRAHYCHQTFRTSRERDAHESSHVKTFFCLRCDFVPCGFRSKENLKKHTERYHMSVADYEVPESLCSTLNDLSISNGLRRDATSAGAGSSTSWSKQGRKATQESFLHIVDKVEASLSENLFSNDQPESHLVKRTNAASNSAHLLDPFASGLAKIRHRVEDQRYDTLGEFQEDVRELIRKSNSLASSSISDRVRSICEEELGKTLSDFPAFVAGDHDWNSKFHARLSSQSPMQNASTESTTHVAHDASSDSMSEPSVRRRAYWSKAEEGNLPRLLERCGRNIVEIADGLKTKTPEEVFDHIKGRFGIDEKTFLQGVPLRRNSAAILDDQEVQSLPTKGESEVENTLEPVLTPSQDVSTMHSGHQLLETSAMDCPSTGTSQNWSWYTAPTSKDLDAASGPSGSNQPAEKQTQDQDPQRPKKSRRPPIKQRCNHCGRTCYDESAAGKHVKRFHTPNREVWICQDKSLDHTFFSGCKPCSSKRKYTSRHNAFKHLRSVHFPCSTSEEALARWIDRMEEPNPNYEYASENRVLHLSRPEGSRRPRKRQKTDPPTIKEPSNFKDEVIRLPPIVLKQSATEEESRSDGEEEFDWEDIPKTDEVPDLKLFTGVSFDHLLPQPVSSTSATYHNDGADNLNRSWIRPNQVDRLPYLNPHQKILCKDQVEALLHTLQSSRRGSLAYISAEHEIDLLSRRLLIRLRDWRKRTSLGLTLPVSL